MPEVWGRSFTHKHPTDCGMRLGCFTCVVASFVCLFVLSSFLLIWHLMIGNGCVWDIVLSYLLVLLLVCFLNVNLIHESLLNSLIVESELEMHSILPFMKLN